MPLSMSTYALKCSQLPFYLALNLFLACGQSGSSASGDPSDGDLGSGVEAGSDGSSDSDIGADTAADGGGDSAGSGLPLTFGDPGQLAGAEGEGSFLFGVATAAAQIEEDNTASDWWLWTAEPPDGLAQGTFVGDAVMGYERAIDDIDLISAMHLDTYRFNVNWPRVEPSRDAVSESALRHYDALIDALVARAIRPMITVHHFSNPVWVDDPRLEGCTDGPTDSHLCGWGDSEGGRSSSPSSPSTRP